jgi:TPR repeat protein
LEFSFRDYFPKLKDIEVNINEASFLTMKFAVDQGCDPAQSSGELCPQNGDGILVDLERAVHYYQLAAD